MKHTLVTLFSIMLLTLTSRSLAQEPLPVYLDDSQPVEARIEDALSRNDLKGKNCYHTRPIEIQRTRFVPGWESRNCAQRRSARGAHGVCVGRLEPRRLDQRLVYRLPGSHLSGRYLQPQTWLSATAMPSARRPGYREKGHYPRPRGQHLPHPAERHRNFEYMGEDPYLSSRMVVPYVKGMQQNGVAACLKTLCPEQPGEEPRQHQR